MSFAKEDGWVRKSKLAKNGPSLLGRRPHRKSDASALAKAAIQPSSPPASLNLALRAENRGFVMRWTTAHPDRLAAALYSSTAVASSGEEAIASLSFWLLASGFWCLRPALSSGLTNGLFSACFPSVGFPPFFPFFRAIADFFANRVIFRE